MKSILLMIDCPGQLFAEMLVNLKPTPMDIGFNTLSNRLACIHGYSRCHVGEWVNSIMIAPWQIGTLECHFINFN